MQNDILNFNKEWDNLIISVKNENKNDSLKNLANLYQFLPFYYKKISKIKKENISNMIYETVLKTKSDIFYGYASLENNNWQEILEYVKKAIEDYSLILDGAGTANKEYEVNRGYIILNELEQAAHIQDKNVFSVT